MEFVAHRGRGVVSLPYTTPLRQPLNILKNYLNKNSPKPTSHFAAGTRQINIVHTKLRQNCILNKDLFRRNIIDSPFGCQVVKYTR